MSRPGATVEFQSRTFRIARYCVRRRWEPQGAVNLDPDYFPRIAAVEAEWNFLAACWVVDGGPLSGVDAASRGAAVGICV